MEGEDPDTSAWGSGDSDQSFIEGPNCPSCGSIVVSTTGDIPSFCTDCGSSLAELMYPIPPPPMEPEMTPMDEVVFLKKEITGRFDHKIGWLCLVIGVPSLFILLLQGLGGIQDRYHDNPSGTMRYIIFFVILPLGWIVYKITMPAKVLKVTTEGLSLLRKEKVLSTIPYSTMTDFEKTFSRFRSVSNLAQNKGIFFLIQTHMEVGRMMEEGSSQLLGEGMSWTLKIWYTAPGGLLKQRLLRLSDMNGLTGPDIRTIEGFVKTNIGGRPVSPVTG